MTHNRIEPICLLVNTQELERTFVASVVACMVPFHDRNMSHSHSMRSKCHYSILECSNFSAPRAAGQSFLNHMRRSLFLFECHCRMLLHNLLPKYFNTKCRCASFQSHKSRWRHAKRTGRTSAMN